MADKNQLTVAELLARNKKARGEEGKDDKRSRRHRRSLDEGGISVAELTGNLKKVKASPAEAKHTSVSIDEDAPVIRAPKSAGKDEADSAQKPAEKPAAPKAKPKAAAKPAAKSTDKPRAKSAAKTAAASSAAAQAAQKPAAAGAAQEAAKKNQPSADDTAVIQRVDKAKADGTKPAAAKAGAKPAAKPAAEKSTAEKATTDKTAADKAAADHARAEKSGVEKQGAAKPAAEKPKSDKGEKTAEAGAIGAGAAAAAAVPASKKAGVAKNAEETGNLPKVEDDEEWVEEEHEKLNPVSILLMIVAGILLAIVIFKGFEILWDNFPRLVVAILALCVTAIMVGVTHALRTARDGFSMFLAGFTGLILAFGPLLLVML